MNLNFKPMQVKKSYQHIVEEVQSAICKGELEAGDRLPPEMKLKEMFDTSRGTVREALRVLENKGLICIKTGVKGGAVVKESNTEAMGDSLGLLIRHQKISLEHLAEFRKLMEGYVAEQAARIADSEDIENLGSILALIKDLVDTKPDGWKKFHQLDALFHKTLADVAANPMVQVNLQTIHENIEIYFDQYLPFSQALLEQDFNDLAAILKAIENHDEHLAGKIARDHVSRFNALMEEHIKFYSLSGPQKGYHD